MTAAFAAPLKPVNLAGLPGWQSDDHAAALQSFRRSCTEILGEGAGFGRNVLYGGRREDWMDVCRKAERGHPQTFFEENFIAFRVADPERPEGLFTGYFEPEAEGSRIGDGNYTVPVYRRPPDLVSFSSEQKDKTGLSYGRLRDGKPRGYYTRQEIEQGALQGQGLEIVWLKDWIDAFFIHIQGSGRVRLMDGSVMRLAYGAKSGLPYSSIGRVLVDRGVFTPEKLSMQVLRQWMAEHPSEARELMWQNESYIFFREAELADPSLGALGAQHVQLTPMRSIAADRHYWMLGTPVWLDTKVMTAPQSGMADFRKLLIAQDTGSAIKGLARGDVFWGFGEDAAFAAGHMKSPGTMTVLLPKAVAHGLGLLR